VVPKTQASKDVTAGTATINTEDQSDDNAPTPKQWSSDWDPTLNSLLSTYVSLTACYLHAFYLAAPITCSILLIYHDCFLTCFKNNILFFKDIFEKKTGQTVCVFVLFYRNLEYCTD